MPWNVVVEHQWQTDAAEFCDLKAAELGGEFRVLGSTEVSYEFPEREAAMQFIAAVAERGLPVDQEPEEVVHAP